MQKIDSVDINNVMTARRLIQRTVNRIESRDAGGLLVDLNDAIEDIDEWLDNAKEMF